MFAVKAPLRSQLPKQSSKRLTGCAYLQQRPDPPHLNRTLSKPQSPFPGFNYAYRLSHQNNPATPVPEQKKVRSFL